MMEANKILELFDDEKNKLLKNMKNEEYNANINEDANMEIIVSGLCLIINRYFERFDKQLKDITKIQEVNSELLNIFIKQMKEEKNGDSKV